MFNIIGLSPMNSKASPRHVVVLKKILPRAGFNPRTFPMFDALPLTKPRVSTYTDDEIMLKYVNLPTSS